MEYLKIFQGHMLNMREKITLNAAALYMAFNFLIPGRNSAQDPNRILTGSCKILTRTDKILHKIL